ncbi:hypothetical protein EEB15_27685 [Ramlibacter sp. WS9]|nr:hypothetical protein EEB15_27685 [Ramlibacter sp. WS9]
MSSPAPPVTQSMPRPPVNQSPPAVPLRIFRKVPPLTGFMPGGGPARPMRDVGAEMTLSAVPPRSV